MSERQGDPHCPGDSGHLGSYPDHSATESSAGLGQVSLCSEPVFSGIIVVWSLSRA